MSRDLDYPTGISNIGLGLPSSTHSPGHVTSIDTVGVALPVRGIVVGRFPDIAVAGYRS